MVHLLPDGDALTVFLFLATACALAVALVSWLLLFLLKQVLDAHATRRR